MAETKNLDLLMDRCWYGLAGTIFKDGTECFWEINWWDGQEREGKRIFTNQTIVTVNGDWLPSDRCEWMPRPNPPAHLDSQALRTCRPAGSEAALIAMVGRWCRLLQFVVSSRHYRRQDDI